MAPSIIGGRLIPKLLAGAGGAELQSFFAGPAAEAPRPADGQTQSTQDAPAPQLTASPHSDVYALGALAYELCLSEPAQPDATPRGTHSAPYSGLSCQLP